MSIEFTQVIEAGNKWYNTSMKTYKSNDNIVYSCKYHVVWCPKYRRKVLTNGIDARLKELLLDYAANIYLIVIKLKPSFHHNILMYFETPESLS